MRRLQNKLQPDSTGIVQCSVSTCCLHHHAENVFGRPATCCETDSKVAGDWNKMAPRSYNTGRADDVSVMDDVGIHTRSGRRPMSGADRSLVPAFHALSAGISALPSPLGDRLQADAASGEVDQFRN